MKPKLSPFGILQEQDIQWILDQGIKRELAVGDILIKEGSYIHNLFIILEGTLSVFVSQQSEADRENPDQEIARITQGEIVGEISFLDKLPTSATVKSFENSVVLSLSWQQLSSKLNYDLGFASRFYQSLCILLAERMRKITFLLVSRKVLSNPPLRKVLFVFGILDDIDIDWILATGKLLQYSPGTVLLQQGETVESLYILLEGKLAVFLEIIENEVKIIKEVAQLPQGEIVGEMSFVETGKASATVKASAISLLLAIPQQKLRTKLENDMGFASRFYRAITVVITDRLRERMISRGYRNVAYIQSQSVSETMEDEDELNLDTLENTALAATRFNWLLKQVRNSY
ncbi:cyclic nucleotide-binding domain-containing protein [Anabaena sp. WFMT]|uniref:cyclic nucleotide-binding domain-containing protein n=1 Tax=Anabaena sp. WFMT TaxID=3449730 RepID=UPI003F26CFDE